MADKTYVNVDTINVKETFDNKYKSRLQKVLGDGLDKAIERSKKLTTKEPKDKKTEGFYLSGSVSLKKTKTGVEAKLSLVMASWPGKSIFGSTNNDASMDLDDPDKVSDGDIDDLVEALLADAAATVVKELEKKVK